MEKYLQEQISNGYFLISSCNLYDVMWKKKMSEVGLKESNRPVAGIRPPPLLYMEDNLSANWKLFKLKWHNYAIITYLTRQSLQYQTVLSLHTLGDEALKVYHGFQFLTTRR